MFFYRRKYVFFLSCGLCLLLAGAFYRFVFLAQRAELAETRRQAAGLEQQIRETKELLARREDPAAYGKELTERQRRNSRLLPDALGTSAFLSDLEGWAAASGIHVTGVKPRDAGAGGELLRQEIEVAWEGDYFQTLDFLYRLEQGRRFVTVDRLTGESMGQGIFACRAGISIHAAKAP